MSYITYQGDVLGSRPPLGQITITPKSYSKCQVSAEDRALELALRASQDVIYIQINFREEKVGKIVFFKIAF